MARFDSQLLRLEERASILPGGIRTVAEEIKLQEVILGACYGVREAALKIVEAFEAGENVGQDRTFPDRFMQQAEVELIQKQKVLRELTQDDDQAWKARLTRIEHAQQQRPAGRTRRVNSFIRGGNTK